MRHIPTQLKVLALVSVMLEAGAAIALLWRDGLLRPRA
jgi:hypothetical protein